MFDNPGKKIKTLAKILFWVNVSLSFIGVIILTTIESYSPTPFLGGYSIAIYIFIFLCGCLYAFLNSLLIYALGEIVHNSTKTTYLTKEIRNSVISAYQEER